VVGRPRCSRICLTSFFSVIKASTTWRPSQGQRSTSSRKTRRRAPPSYDELEALLGELLEDPVARVAFTIATSAEAAATERAMRDDVSPDRPFVQVRGSKRATRWRKVPIVASWQRELLDFALEHAQGRDERLFLPRTKFGQTLERACARAGIPRCTPNDLRRTYSTWLRADGVPNELSAPTMGHKDTRMLDRVYARLPPELLRLRLLAALGRCSAGAINTSDPSAQNGRTGQPADDVTAEKLAPRAGFEPATHGLTVRCSLRLRCRHHKANPSGAVSVQCRCSKTEQP